MKTLLIFSSSVLLAFAIGCNDIKPPSQTKQMSEGVVLYGCDYGDGLLENTNTYTVRIRQVWQYSGEYTQSINLLAPGAKLSINGITNHNGFYVYTMDGAMVGFLSGNCP